MTNPSAEFSSVVALREMERTPYADVNLREDKEFALKQLRLSEQEFEKIMCADPKTYRDFPSSGLILKEISFFRELSKKVAKRI